MNVLIGNNHLHMIGGTEMFTYSLAYSLKKIGHSVEYFTFDKGITSDRLEHDLSIPFMSKTHYDAILVNHNTVVEYIKHNNIDGPVIQTCHGIVSLERPSPLADYLIFISERLVHDAIEYANELALTHHLYLHKLRNCKVVWNGINTDRLYSTHAPRKKLSHILSLAQSDVANDYIKQACDKLNIRLTTHNKLTNGLFDIQLAINDADLVIGVGRSGYDAMACGRPVIAFDWRSYSSVPMGTGYLDSKNIYNAMFSNLTGRPDKYVFNPEQLVNQLCDSIARYNHTDGDFMRYFAVSKLNMDTHAKYYLDLASNIHI